MPGQNSQTTNQQQATNSNTNPWSPAIPSITNLLSQIGSLPTGVTPGQSGALTTLSNEASAIPNFGPQGANSVNNLFNSSTAPQQGLLADAYNKYVTQMSPYTSPTYLNPNNNPLMQPVLDQIANEATRNVEGQFEASGRDPMDNVQASKVMAKAIAAGEAPALLGQYNTDVTQAQNAGTGMFQGATTTASGETQQQQVPLENQIAALGAAGQIPGLLMQGGTNALNVANMTQQMPFENLLTPEQMILPIGQMGQEGTGTSTGVSQTVQPQNMLTNILGGGLGLMGLLAMSDIRLKDDVEPIGLMFSGLPIYRFRYLTDPEHSMRIGVMAQDVEEVMPEAVTEIGGYKAVDYDAITREASDGLVQ